MRQPTTAAVVPPHMETTVVSPAGQVVIQLYLEVAGNSLVTLDDEGRLAVRPVRADDHGDAS